MASIDRTDRIETLKEYFRRVDAGQFPAELFTPDFQFSFPKFGVGHGPAQFMELAMGLKPTRLRGRHHIEEFLFIEGGRHVAVEGTSEGTGSDHAEWHGGRTPGGRFCSVFAFDDAGRIERMHVYLDPDYCGADKARFLWPNRADQGW